jgi:hypothetical protein
VASLPLTSSWPAKLRLDKDGRGEGKLFPATEVTYDKAKRTIDVENYETSLVQRTHSSGGSEKPLTRSTLISVMAPGRTSTSPTKVTYPSL